MPERLLLILTGPVGGGKSTVALALAERLRTNGRHVGVVDLDLVADMMRSRADHGEPDRWQMARRACAGLADLFYREGLGIVIVEGEFFSRIELDALCCHLAAPVTTRFFTLAVSYEQALIRVSRDATRGLSRDPTFLRRMHDQYQMALPFLRSVGPVIAADAASPEELARTICVCLHDAGILLSYDSEEMA